MVAFHLEFCQSCARLTSFARIQTYSSIMFANGCMDDTAVEENFGRVGDGVESPQGFFEFLIVIAPKRFHPSLDFL